MILTERYYTLPDGTRIQAVRTPSENWRLIGPDGRSLYYVVYSKLWRMEHVGDGVRLEPTDLTFDDLLIAD